MDKLLSQKELDRFYNEKLKNIGRNGLDNLRRESRVKDGTSGNANIFLCHSHRDKTIIDKIIILFSNMGLDVYADWMDTSLPESTDKTTAIAIKNRIESSNKFIFLATYHALRSKWCNWELGLAYSNKGDKDFAILPIMTRNEKWRGNEYLQLFPEMQIDFLAKDTSPTKEDVTIKYSDENILPFSDWLSTDNK